MEHETRIERDALGERELPAGALYGIHSLRAAENFALGYGPVHPRLLRAMVLVKKAAAQSWEKLSDKPAVYRAIAEACDRLLGEWGLSSGEQGLGAGVMESREQISILNPQSSPLIPHSPVPIPHSPFIIDALQGGAGTSTNMNVNEVVANLALEILGKKPGDYDTVHPLDDVNRGQSTNDVYPTALRIAAVELLRELSGECAKLQESLQMRENEFADIKKLGRTELMDAVPVTLGGEFGAYAQAIARDRWRLYKIEERLRQVNLGGAAVGSDAAAPDPRYRKYRYRVIEALRELCGIGLAAAEYPMDITQNNDVFVEVSGLLKALSVNLCKIAGDFRLMNSGPRGGLGEIRLEALQAGSTIMPGKVNPVIPEMVIQTALKVQANDYAITAAASRGEFELNAFLPLIAETLLESLALLTRSAALFRTRCVDTLKAEPERCAALLEASCAFAFVFVPALGYEQVGRIIAEQQGDPVKVRQALEAAVRAC